MKRCKHCGGRCWPWQSYSYEIAEVTDTEKGFVLIHASYEKDVVIHDSCYFLELLNIGLGTENNGEALV